MTKPRLRRYRLYLDESGDHTYKALEQPRHRYLGLTGCYFTLEDYLAFAHSLEELKHEYFAHYPHRDRDEPIILHRNDIINRRGVFSLLKDPEVEERFNNDLLRLFGDAQYKIISVVIDKKKHLERYGDHAFHPYHYCLAAILERYCGFLNYFNARGDVMAEARGGTEDKQLKSAYRRIYESGTLWRNGDFFQKALTSKEIKLKRKKANIAGLQLSDCLVYPIKQTMLLEQKRIKDPGDVFGKRVYEKVSKKFNRQIYDGRVWGYGKIWLPTK